MAYSGVVAESYGCSFGLVCVFTFTVRSEGWGGEVVGCFLCWQAADKNTKDLALDLAVLGYYCYHLWNTTQMHSGFGS